MHQVEQARHQLSAQGFDGVDIAALVLGHGEQARVHGCGVQGGIGLEDHHSGLRTRSLAHGGAAMAIRLGEVADGRAPDEVVLQLAVHHHVDRLRRHAFVVHRIGAEQRLAGEGGLERIVGHAHEVWQHAGVEAGGVLALGARGSAQLGPFRFHVGDEEPVHDVRGSVSAEQHGAVVVLGGDHGGVAQRLQTLDVVEDAVAEYGPGFEMAGGYRYGPILAGKRHAVGSLSAYADVGGVAGIALANRGPFGIDQIAIDRQGAQAGGGVLHIGGKRTDLRVGGVEPARLHDAALPLRAVDLQRDQRADVDDGLGRSKILLGGRGFEALQLGLFGGVGAQSVLVGLVGGGPQAVADGLGIVVGGGEGDRTFAAGAAGVGGVAADAHGDAHDPLAAGFFAHQRAEVGDRLVGGEVVQAVLNEVGPLHAGKQQLGLLAVELGLHGAQHRVVGGLARCRRGIGNGTGAKQDRGEENEYPRALRL